MTWPPAGSSCASTICRVTLFICCPGGWPGPGGACAACFGGADPDRHCQPDRGTGQRSLDESTSTARRGGRLVGVLPLVRHGDAFRSPVNPKTPEFRLLVEGRDGGRRARQRGLRQPSPPGDACADRRSQTHNCPVPGAAENARYALLVRTVLRPPYLVIDDGKPTSVASAGSASAKFRRRRPRLEELGEVVVEISDGRQRQDKLWEVSFRSKPPAGGAAS